MLSALTRTQARLATARITRSSMQRRNFVSIIQQGHEGWRLTFGRDPVKLEPGLNLAIPIYHEVLVMDMRESSISIPNLTGYTSDNVPVTCSGSLFYRVNNGYKALFEVSNVHENIKNTGTSAVRSLLGLFSYDQVISDRNELNKQLNTVIGNSIANWGVECSRFEIQTFKPANREVERQLELQMEAERNRRKQLLDTQAQINVAEGQKQRVILESEGHLEAKSNEADASFKTVVREAEARQKQALLEASALASQVEELARSIAKDKDNILPEERQRALTSLIEIRRLDQLKAIAQSKSNSTYFFGDQAALGRANDSYNIDYAEHIKGGLYSKPVVGRPEAALLV
ncbi:hypothetical protein E4T56_gene10681 [Termitomyces sp. T112]|nr:hypothetical protein E4T56_gene10681 [Termitomyces sp. T112]KAH0581886.1 hypothetical protein H2248_011570 [Termitomyces sp. 'cryptogamus']KNZ81629.1 hypothetical protein J132_11263 [Termitomyces sp. J132]